MSQNDPIRNYVKALYPNRGWALQVDRMSKEQVYAIYMKDQEKKAKEEDEPKPPDQGTLF
jgi:hypothetical protein